MRKKLVTLFVFILSIAFVYSQAGGRSASVTLSLRLTPIQTLTVNSSQQQIDLVYADAQDYQDGVSAEQQNHLNIFSTGAFTVNVHSESEAMHRSGGDATIPTNTLSVRATAGASNALSEATMNEVNLSSTAVNLISSTIGGADRNFNITYSGMGADAYVNKYYNTESTTVYSTTVTYSIEAK